MKEIKPESYSLENARTFIGLFKTLFKRTGKHFLYVIVFSAIVGSSAGGWTYYNNKTHFAAYLTFMVSQAESSGGGVGAILSQFGLGGAGGGSKVNLAKIAYLSRSKLIGYEILMDSLSIDGVRATFAEHILRLGLVSGKKGEILQFENEFKLDTINRSYADLDSLFTLGDKTLLAKCYRLIAGPSPNTGYVELVYNDINGIIGITATTPNEEISQWVAIKTYDKIQEFYMRQAIGQHQSTVRLLKGKMDSLENEISSLDYRISRISDQSLRIVLSKDRVLQNRLVGKKQIAMISFGEITRNYQTALFLLQSETPTFRLLEYPLLPLEKKDDSWKKSFLLTFFGVSILTLGAIFAYHTYLTIEKV
jgi:hypothetical protein